MNVGDEVLCVRCDRPKREHETVNAWCPPHNTMFRALQPVQPTEGSELLREDVESLAAKFHEIYQQEAKRQGDVRHQDSYADLPENVKEFDRVLARYVLAALAAPATAEEDIAGLTPDEKISVAKRAAQPESGKDRT